MSLHSTRSLLNQPWTWLLLYLVAHFIIRLFFSPTLQLDDAEQVRLSQTLALGYPIPQPPLYSWLSWGLFQWMETGLLPLTLLKYLLIGLTFWFLWLSSHYLFTHQQTRWLATFSLLLMPSFAWHMHQGFTHTILLGLAIAMSLHALLRLPRHDTSYDYLYLGFALGTGLMAKYSFVLFMIPLLIAALSISEYRQKLATPLISITIITIMLWVTPHLIWLGEHYQEIYGSIDQKLQISNQNTFWSRLSSLGNFLSSAIAFTIPWAILFTLLTGQQLFKSRNKAVPPSTQLLTRFYWIILLSVLLLSLFLSMPHFKVRWFHPLMMIFPLWWLSRTEAVTPPSSRLLYWTSAISLGLTVLILVIRMIQTTVGPELGHYSRLNRPIMETLTQLPPVTKHTLIKTNDDFLGAHLLSHYPEQNIQIRTTLYARKELTTPASCLVLWDNDEHFSKPDLSNLISEKSLSITKGEVQYTLYTAIVPTSECQ